MRLLFVTQDFPPDVGGIQTYSWELVRRWMKEISLRVVAPDRPEAPGVDADLTASVARVPCAPEMLPLRGVPAIVREARSFRPDVAFHAQWQTLGASFLAQRLTGFPRRIVCAAHGRELLFNPLRGIPVGESAYDSLRRLLLRIPDRFVPVSRYTGGLLQQQGVDPANIRVAPNGVDPDRFYPIERAAVRERLALDDSPLLLTVGRLVPRKGLDTTIRALPTLLEDVPDARYIIVGSGPDEDRLRGLVNEHNLHDVIRFTGQVPWSDLLLYYNAADVFVMPSREDPPDVEGFGLVFLEANACGTPVVGADAGGVPDAIVDQQTGFLVPPSDPEALAHALSSLLTDRERARAMGKAGRKRAETVASWDAVADALLQDLRAVT